MRVVFDCAQQLLVVQQTSNSATRSQNIFATLKAKGGAGLFCHLADCAYTDFGVAPWGVPSTSVRRIELCVKLDKKTKSNSWDGFT